MSAGMDNPSRKASLAAYQAEREADPRYAGARQAQLKARVFDTFDALLRHRGRPGLVAGTRLVDLGAGDGAFVRLCRERGLAALGFDAVDGIDLETDRLPLDDAAVDVATAISVIEHLRSPAHFLAEIGRVLAPGGALILVTPNWRYSWRSFYDDPTHVHPYTPASLRRALAAHGFAAPYVVPWLVKKPARLWDRHGAFFKAYWTIPFRGDAPAWIPAFLRGRSASILALATKAAP
jgi:SAM-dependent methyltransferase